MHKPLSVAIMEMRGIFDFIIQYNIVMRQI